MNVDDAETACVVELDDIQNNFLEGFVATIGNVADGTKLKVTGDGVEENVSLDVEKIDAEDDVAVVVDDVCREGNSDGGIDSRRR